MLSTRRAPAVAVFPDSDKVGVFTDDPGAAVMVRRSSDGTTGTGRSRSLRRLRGQRLIEGGVSSRAASAAAQRRRRHADDRTETQATAVSCSS